MKTLKEISWSNTEALRRAYNSYCMSSYETLSDAYGRYSEAKSKAYDYCIDLMKRFNSDDLRIIGHNTYMFSAGFTFDVLDSETYEVKKAFCYITPSYDKFMLLD